MYEYDLLVNTGLFTIDGSCKKLVFFTFGYTLRRFL